MRFLLLTLLAPLALDAQITLSSLNGIVETPLTSVYGYGQVSSGDSKDVLFRARNSGTASVSITVMKVTGTGFSVVNSSSTPIALAPGGVQDFFARFTAGAPGPYSATVQVNTVSAILLATSVPGVSLTIADPCTGPDSSKTIDFGRVPQGTQVSCNATLQNPFSDALTVSPISISGPTFSTTASTSLTIPGGQSLVIPLTFTASLASAFTGALTVGTRVYTLTGTGSSAPLPSPIFSFDSTTFLSGEQHALTLKLSSTASTAAFGNLTLTFTPSISSVTDDSAVQFVATSKRVVSFTVAAGDTAVKFNNQPSVTFATGTTAGKITFTLDAGVFGLSGSTSTSFTIVSAPLTLSAVSAGRGPNRVDIAMTGFDNTYTAGSMAFTFYDHNGNTLGGVVPADFTSNFRTFYQGQTVGSAFQLGINFPLAGDATVLGGVEVSLSNSVGVVRTQRLSFP